MHKVSGHTVSLEPVRDSYGLLWGTCDPVPPICREVKTVPSFDHHLVNLCITEARVFLEVWLVKVDRAVVHRHLRLGRLCLSFLSLINQVALEGTNDRKLFPSLVHTHKVLVLVRVRQ